MRADCPVPPVEDGRKEVWREKGVKKYGGGWTERSN